MLNNAGSGRSLGLVFLNPSLRTRVSTQKAARMLGMEVMVMNIGQDGWALELEDDVIMNGTGVEHIREAAGVLGRYFDILGVRTFPGLKHQKADYAETILNKFIAFSQIPVLSLESATRHPLQSLADLITIREHTVSGNSPKVVLSWAPHVKPLPQAVANSFAEWMLAAGHHLTIAHPPGYALGKAFTHGAEITYDQDKALEGADFVYVKNWSAYDPYGTMPPVQDQWMLTENRLPGKDTKIMHCLPVRRGLELGHDILNGPRSLVLDQAENRIYAAAAALKWMIEQNF